jgi:transposase
MKTSVFWGIDISKETLDICILSPEGKQITMQIKNKKSSIEKAITKQVAELGGNWADHIFCMENTGWYGALLLDALVEKTPAVYVVNPLQLKRSMGITRGKNDEIDAIRIAQYIARFHDDLKPFIVQTSQIKLIKICLTKRNQFIKTVKQLSTSTNEMSGFVDNEIIASIRAVERKTLKEAKKAIKELDKIILNTIKACPELLKLFKLINSVPGVGQVLAASLLVTTNQFKRLSDPRKLASFCGVVPFDHSSGKSVYKKPRVSHLADKRLKCLLHMAALSTIRKSGAFKDYLDRRVELGKNKMSVLNAIRNKIILRVCAVVRDQKNYTERLVMS